MVGARGAAATRHLEAYIRLEAATCEKMFRRRLARAQWHDQLGEFCGSVLIRNLSGLHMLISYSAVAPGSSGYAGGETLLRLERVATNPRYSKPYFRCPQCSGRSGQIILADEAWACRRCHGLAYRSQRLTHSQAQQQRLDALTQLLQPVGGTPRRPRYMRPARFEALSAEYSSLRSELKDRPRAVVHRGLGLTLSARWEPSSAPESQ